MKQISISVIISVYNMEQYLPKCLESVINQNLRDIEIIVVNDGSSDNSLEIIRKYEAIDSRIIVINQKNMGCSVARNNGVKIAKGEYVVFVDSDDYILEKGLDELIKEGRQYKLDIVLPFLYSTFNNKQVIKNKEFYKVKTGETYLIEKLNDRDHLIRTTSKLYRLQFLLENNISFPEGLVHEDQYYDLISLYYAKRIKFINIKYYIIVGHSNSITRRTDRKINGHNIHSICVLLENFFSTCPNKQLKILIYDYLARLYLYGIDFGNLYDENIDKRFLRHKAYFSDIKVKVFIFNINKYLYKWIKKLTTYSK